MTTRAKTPHAWWETDPTADADGFRIEKGGEYGDHVAVTLVPGFIEVNSGVQSGAPCAVGTRTPCYVGMGWILEGILNNEDDDSRYGIDRETAVALAAFDAGVEWQRKRARRKRFYEKANELWRASPAYARVLAEAIKRGDTP